MEANTKDIFITIHVTYDTIYDCKIPYLNFLTSCKLPFEEYKSDNKLLLLYLWL